MRYSLTLPLALAALAAAPALSAQDATPPSGTTTTQTPPPVDTVTPAPTEPVTTPPTEAQPTEPAPQPDAATAADPATPAQPATAPQPASAPATPATPATAATPATPTDTAAKVTLTAEQKAAYDAWPAGARTYFDGLTASRQEIFLRLKDEDKLKLVALAPAQQASTWTSLEKQDADQKAKAPKTM